MADQPADRQRAGDSEMMQALTSGLTVWHWFILGAVMIAIEMLMPGVVFLWLGIAAICAGVVIAVVPAIGWESQILIFAIFAVISIVAGRRWLANRPTVSDHPTLNRRGADYVGRSYVLSAAVTAGSGTLIIDDTTWQISGEDAPAGTRVRVIGLDGMTLLVEPAAD